MKLNRIRTVLVLLGIIMLVLFLAVGEVFSHCDTMAGPVITDARKALDKGDVKPVLKWVQKADEDQIRKAFDKTLSVRKLSTQAKELADMYFFETLVRIHRAGEGEPYTGLKPADTIDPAIAAADKAIEAGSVDELAQEIANMVSTGIRQRLGRVSEAKKHVDESAEAGRNYVSAYVEFIHYVEALHATASGAQLHHTESQQPAATEELKH
jgi:hypothetical protein